LLRAVLALEHDHSPRAIAAVTELADRAQRDGGHIPFDAQTAFYRIRAAAPPERAAQLASVAWRLGFADGEGEGGGGGAQLAGDGRLELLLSGLYEPVLASLPREDRVEQIRWMREAVERRFGAKAHGGGLWLTERVWEPELAADLAQAGVRYAFVDDRHFLVTGFAADRLHAPFWTESDGKRVAVFPIDERRARLPADGVVPRDGRLGAAARRRTQAGATRARPRRGAARRSRRRVGTGGALAEFLPALSRGEPNAQEDAGAVGVVPALWGSGGGAPGDRPRAVQRRVLARRVRRAGLAASAAACLAPARAGRGRAAAGRAARRRARRPGR